MVLPFLSLPKTLIRPATWAPTSTTSSGSNVPVAVMVTKRSPRLMGASRKAVLWAAWARHCQAPTPAERTRMTAAVTVALRGARINQFVASTTGLAGLVAPAADECKGPSQPCTGYQPLDATAGRIIQEACLSAPAA